MKTTFLLGMRRLGHLLWSLFVSGFFTILPLAITLALLNLSIRLVLRWLAPLHDVIEPTMLGRIPYSEIILAIIIILLLGIIMKVFILRTLIHMIEDIIFRLPLIKTIYAGMKQLVKALNVQDKVTFTQVVYIEFPHDGIYSLGFVTSTMHKEIAPNKELLFYNVFIPTTPNPTSGFFVLVPTDKVTFAALSRQEAMAMIISGGIIQPKHLEGRNNHEGK